MSDPQNPNQSSFRSPIPPPPPSAERSRSGCLRVALLGCGGVILLGILAVVFTGIWWKRNRGDIEAEAIVAAREGARYGVSNDEAACFEQAKQRAGGSLTVAGSFSVGAYMRSCLEFSRQTPAFCDDVPPQAALRRTIEWQAARCGDDTDCRNVAQVVQQYCTTGRVKRPAADTVRVMRDSTWSPLPPAPGAAEAEADSGTF
ncbi:MAG TPA: hypothetical protein VEQ60_27850 [Longimicrobium sp.]|nr:hypothetical protein [Longimicrobium sp.]